MFRSIGFVKRITLPMKSSRVSLPVYFVSLLGFEEVVALNRIDLPWLDKPSDIGINSGLNPFSLLFLSDAPIRRVAL